MENSPPTTPLHSDQETSSGWGVAWGNWGNSAFSVFSGIQKVAASAADEITKNALAVAKDAGRGMVELQDKVTSSLKMQSEDDATNASDTKETEDDTAELPEDNLRRVTLKKLEEAGQDGALSHGLNVIDTSVENIASGAWQAFGNAWKGSKTFIQKLEHTAENFAESIQKQGSFTYKGGALAPSLIEGGKAITAKGLEVLEYVGKEAIDLIATEAGIRLEDDPKPTDGDIIDNEEQFADDFTFDRCFYIYGGPEQLEELEALANHHLLLCNRAKGKLSPEQKSSFDSTLKQLQHVLNLKTNALDSSQHDKGKRLETRLVGDVNELNQIRETSIAKAAEMATGFTASLAGLTMSEMVQKTSDRLDAIRVEGIHKLSELCAAGILQLLYLGKSVLMPTSEEAENPNDVSWPEDCLEKAKLIRAQAQSISGDIEAISNSFVTGIGDVVAAFQAAIRNEAAKEGEKDSANHELIKESVVEDKLKALSYELESAGGAAVDKVQSALQHLVHVVLFTSLKS